MTFDGEEEVFCRRWWHLRLESSWQKVWAGGVWAEGIPAGGSTAGTKCGGSVRSGAGREGGVLRPGFGSLPGLESVQKGLESIRRDWH